MTANKMPEMPEAFAVICGVRRDAPKEMWGYLSEIGALRGSEDVYTADQMRAMYLAGLEAAKACVPAHRGDAFSDEEGGWNHCRQHTLTNLTALEQEAKK